MKEQIEKIKSNAIEEIAKITDLKSLNELKVKFLGKKGELTSVLRGMGALEPEERPVIGSLVNEVRDELESLISEKEENFKQEEMNRKLEKETIDITLPSKKAIRGSKHPINRTIEEIEDLFISMGYEVVDGPELETDEFCFERLNLPKGHPARDMQDSFYINDNLLMRTQTSPVQVRTLLEAQGKPVKIVCPGKVYRRDDDDATHSHQFMQLEGLVVAKNITMSDLKGTLSFLMKKMFGENRKIRFKPSYFPFTEPSVEVDVRCFKCGGKGCPMCKHTGWIEVLGAGMVHPHVLEGAGYDPKVWKGFAFGAGIERLTMLRHNIDDIRNFYVYDFRFLKQFEGER